MSDDDLDWKALVRSIAEYTESETTDAEEALSHVFAELERQMRAGAVLPWMTTVDFIRPAADGGPVERHQLYRIKAEGS